ncbi:hypothetical protein L6452_26225 [Arctium lappa]|uniref:Uncharacterized protein n=1 Tax=Arctium lappa TaxID=4217 RepID=A0ACB9AC60_ARCLA|nr:hypothetical protein L6452_26225 [Arctium lappa]
MNTTNLSRPAEVIVDSSSVLQSDNVSKQGNQTLEHCVVSFNKSCITPIHLLLVAHKLSVDKLIMQRFELDEIEDPFDEIIYGQDSESDEEKVAWSNAGEQVVRTNSRTNMLKNSVEAKRSKTKQLMRTKRLTEKGLQ